MYKHFNPTTLSHDDLLGTQYYINSDLCTQAQISAEIESGQNSVLSRMENLRAFARLQRDKKLKAEGAQTSFCF